MAFLVERRVKLSRLPDIESMKRSALVEIANKQYDRLATFFPGDLSLEVHFRETHKLGKREQFEVKASVHVAGISLHASSVGWDAEAALRDACFALEKEALKAKSRK